MESGGIRVRVVGEARLEGRNATNNAMRWKCQTGQDDPNDTLEVSTSIAKLRLLNAKQTALYEWRSAITES